MAMQVSVIIPAAGHGRRFQPSAPGPGKVEWALAGKPVLLHAADLFLNREDVREVLIAVPPDQLEHFQAHYGDRLSWLGGRIIAGGTIERWETVLTALKSVDAACTHIAVHDAARPLTSQALIDRVFAAANHYRAAIPATPVGNTLKRVEPGHETTDAEAANDSADEGDPLDALLGAGEANAPPTVQRIVQTVSREHLVAAQTPQVFAADLLQRAYEPLAAGGPSFEVTDDASVVEAAGEAVYTVVGEATNFKLTTPADGELATALLAHRTPSDEPAKKRKADDEDDLF